MIQQHVAAMLQLEMSVRRYGLTIDPLDLPALVSCAMNFDNTSSASQRCLFFRLRQLADGSENVHLKTQPRLPCLSGREQDSDRQRKQRSRFGTILPQYPFALAHSGSSIDGIAYLLGLRASVSPDLLADLLAVLRGLRRDGLLR